jgi:hypothetical protein
MATTTNFGFNTPDNTAYVKDGASAMRTLGNNIDARFGNVGTYPNQLVNVVSGVSRPIPFAMSAGTVSVTQSFGPSNGFYYGSTTVTFPTSRFTQAPIVTVGSSVGNILTTASTGASSTTSVLIYSAGSVLNQVTSVYWTATQMTSAAANG